MSTGILKVTPEKLTQAAGEFQTSGRNISSMTAEMISIVDGFKSIWQGNAATEYAGKFNGLRDDIEKINRMIEEHVNDLNEMALGYQNAEDQSIEESANLISDIAG